ncbi:methylmalonyl-CoA mutase metallochaperone MeaB [Nonlabens sp. Hel1_33_55]|uniref:methylmalonyl Co-A mutase-associated GTPase MeaB n=1 Tax=Nonlabens sp. Hel1_33_55 TaxID=1336802 RepID=UPI000875EB91|nr:methylmalonyl Co-A mutase-associated GTPase MeaB [Nonlabens sp. Hel1_33_55]SCX93096.1 methylmalonyl-CoA mutase metallochaperone MeaB [Nonlabens sp. Hel1_33_55]
MSESAHINPNLKHRKKALDVEELFEQLKNGEISALSKSITLVESTAVSDSAFAKAILSKALPYSGKSFRLGITGVPGVGKSTFIEALGSHLISSGKKVAVLAIDPSSSISRGSILGDKTRMEELVKSDQAFIRPSPAGTTLGGVARKTREAIILCEAAGFDFIIIETVGVGQSETAVHSMTDFFLLLKLAGAGDDLQGIKKGIMEMADLIVINKADGENKTAAKHAQREFKNALHLMPSRNNNWSTKVITASGLKQEGISEVGSQIQEYKAQSESNGSFQERRNLQEIYWLHQTIEDRLKSEFYNRPAIEKHLKNIEQQILDKKITAFEAADILMNKK